MTFEDYITTPTAAAIRNKPGSFYEDFLGLPLTEAFEIKTTKTGRDTGAGVLHSFYQMGDGSFLAFFEAPGRGFEFKEQHDFDLHIALEVTNDHLEDMFARGKAEGREVRGISEHGFCRSIYFRDPNGYVIELAAPTGEPRVMISEAEQQSARKSLDRWQGAKAG